MPQKNVELVRAAYEAWNRGDLDAALENTHGDVQFVQDSRIPGAVQLVGRPAVRAWLESFQDTWAWFRVATERIEAVDEDRVLVVATVSAKGRMSGAKVEQRVGHVLTIDDGQIVRWDSYAAASDALEAMGMRK